MVVKLWHHTSGDIERVDLTPAQAALAYHTYSRLLDNPHAQVTYYRVALEDKLRPGHYLRDSDKDRGVIA